VGWRFSSWPNASHIHVAELSRLRQSGKSKSSERAVALAIETIRRLEIPHLDVEDDDVTGTSVH
jgi:hypothetical protein